MPDRDRTRTRTNERGETEVLVGDKWYVVGNGEPKDLELNKVPRVDDERHHQFLTAAKNKSESHDKQLGSHGSRLTLLEDRVPVLASHLDEPFFDSGVIQAATDRFDAKIPEDWDISGGACIRVIAHIINGTGANADFTITANGEAATGYRMVSHYNITYASGQVQVSGYASPVFAWGFSTIGIACEMTVHILKNGTFYWNSKATTYNGSIILGASFYGFRDNPLSVPLTSLRFDGGGTGGPNYFGVYTRIRCYRGS